MGIGWGPGHIACMFGDMDMLQSCSEEELNGQTANGETPAYYAVRYGSPWCLQWLVEHGADTTTPAVNGYTPEQLIWVNNRNHNAEMEWLEAAMKGELTEGLDPLSEEFLDKNRLKQRMHMYKM